MALGKIISFANQKGGVGKTTSAVNVGASLGILGYRVLLIDLDPQGNATSGVGIAKRSLSKTIYHVLMGDATPAESVVTTPYKNLSIIPANTSLANAEFNLFKVEDENVYIMRNALNQIRDQFDYIIIDCPPSLGMLTINAMSTSDGVIIPMQCEFYALEGLSQLMITVSRIRQKFNPSLGVTGILLTMYSERLLLTLQVTNELKKHYADKLFQTKITRNVKLSEAPGFGMPVYYHDKRSKGAEQYLSVAREFASRI